jgi:hypothetical protein
VPRDPEKPRSATALLVRDELVGFAKSRVILVLWLVLPALALLGFLLLPRELTRERGMPPMTAMMFMSLMVSSLAGTAAGLMAAVDVVSERNRNVFVLFAVRPIRREAIVWAKFIAVFACVAGACIASLLLGLGVDLARGVPVTSELLVDALHALSTTAAAIALSASIGVVFGVMSKTIVVAVLLVLYVGQNLAIVPMLPSYFGVLPDSFWIFIAISVALVVLMLWGGGVLMRRAQL